MARLPSEKYLMQQIGGDVVLFEDYTEHEIARFDPASPGSVRAGLAAVSVSRLDDQDKSFACFWAGYFAWHACHPELADGSLVTCDEEDPAVVVSDPATGRGIVRFDPRDASAAAQAQGAVHYSALADEAKRQAHFWCGYFYGQAG